MRYLPHLVPFCVGFVSLGMEILWVRMVGFAGQSMPYAFAFVLACYLGGIVAGANRGKNLCRNDTDFPLALAKLLGLSAALNFVCVMLFVCAFYYFGGTEFDSYAWALTGLLILVSAATMAAMFPVVHHMSGDRKGAEFRAIHGTDCL